MKIGSVPYLNAKPLIWGLDREPDVQLVFEVPSKLAVMLEKGELAAAMVSSVACFLNPRLQIAPDMSVSCNGPAQSVKLFYRDSLDSIGRVALDTSSLTSVLLGKVILRDRCGLDPEFAVMPPNVEEMLDACDAAVIIGDPAMRVPRGRWPELDLGEEWHALTGLPFVFAVWAVNPDLATPDVLYVLQRSKSFGMRSVDDICHSEARRLGLPFDSCYRYLSEIMSYDLTPRHLEALMLFREKARRLGFVSGDHPLTLYGQPARERTHLHDPRR